MRKVKFRKTRWSWKFIPKAGRGFEFFIEGHYRTVFVEFGLWTLWVRLDWNEKYREALK